MNKADISQLIAQNRLDEAVRALLARASGTRHETEAKHLSARYHELARQERLGIEPPGELERSRNRLTHSLLQLLEELPPDAAAASALAPEHAKKALWFAVAVMGIPLALLLLRPECVRSRLSRADRPVSLHVYVEKQNGGWPDLPFSSEATVKIIFPSGPRTSRLSDGLAIFPGVSPNDLRQPVRVRLENAAPFTADSTFDLHGKPACHLPARAVGLGQVRGQVFDEKKQPLAGAVLTLEGQFDTTGTSGLFEFSIPESQQKDRYRLLGTKTGHRPYDNFINPGSQTQRVDMPRAGK